MVSSVSVIGAGLLLLATTSAVIAASPPIDQPPAVSTELSTEQAQSAALTWFTLTIFVVAATGLVLFIRSRWYRLANAPERSDFLPPAAAMALFLAYLVLPWIGLYSVKQWFWPDVASDPTTVEEFAKLALGAYAAQTLILAIFVFLLRRAGSTSPGQTITRTMLAGIGALALFWPLASVAAVIVESMLRLAGADIIDPVAHETLRVMQRQPIDGWWIALSVCVIIAAPIIEETIYRGVLQHSLVKLKIGRWTAILITSGIFAIMHLHAAELHAVAALFVLSIGFGWVYEKTGRLAAPIIMHILFNAGNLALAMLVAPPAV